MKPNYVIFIVLSFLVLFGWNAVMNKNRPAPAADAATPAASVSLPAGAGAPVVPPVAEERPLELRFGRNRVTFNTRGAGVLQWWLEDGAKVPLVVPNDDGEEPFAAFPALSFQASPSVDGAAFEAKRADGLRVKQSYKIDPDGYLHAVTLSLQNEGKAPADVSFGLGWGPGIESGVDAAGRGSQRMAEERALALEGPRLITLKPGAATGEYRWFGVDARYFLAAFLGEGPLTLDVQKKDKLFSVRRMEKFTLAPGEKRELVQRFYLGPKKHDTLISVGGGLERSINFGMFSTLGRWIYRILLKLHGTVRNFGWSIILLTFGVQLILSPLTMTSFKHSQKMKTIQPQMKRLQEMYKSDPQRLNQEMFALYQRNGLRFMGLEGCLPMVIQMPVFFALYAVFSRTFELRHAPWAGWIKDLSLHDPFYILPVLMGAAMFLQQRMTLSSADPSQKQMMYMMPVMFTFMFLKMPAGLVIYWLTQSLLGFALQSFLLYREQAKKETVL